MFTACCVQRRKIINFHSMLCTKEENDQYSQQVVNKGEKLSIFTACCVQTRKLINIHSILCTKVKNDQYSQHVVYKGEK